MGHAAAGRNVRPGANPSSASAAEESLRAQRERRPGMPRETLEPSSFSPDIRDFIRCLHRHSVRYVIAGGEAVIFYGHVRLTGDVDFFYDNEHSNAERLYSALAEFWQGSVPGLEEFRELTEDGLILQFGMPPNRIDLLNRIDGVDFPGAWESRTVVDLETDVGKVQVNYLGLEELILNKERAGRPKDLGDLPFLRQALETARRRR